MKSPFPGMDPFIEATPGLWGDFHDKLIGELERELSTRVPEHYVVRLNARTYVVIEEAPAGFQMLPDVTVTRRPGRGNGPSAEVTGAATLAAPVVMHAPLEVEHRESFIEIYSMHPERHFVTGIEVLSPSNKRAGTPGWDEYLRRRSAFLNGAANFVEIDLLRDGRRMPMREPWPASPYYVLVSRKWTAPECGIWPSHSLIPLGEIPIPLEGTDADVIVALQPIVDAIYQRARYATDIDYSSSSTAGLSAEEAEFLNAVWTATKDEGARPS